MRLVSLWKVPGCEQRSEISSRSAASWMRRYPSRIPQYPAPAVIRRSAAGFEIEDLRSANGTYVNERLLLAPVLLRNGDRITVGTHELQFGMAQPRVITDSPTVVAKLSGDLDAEKARTVVAPFTFDDSQPPLRLSLGLEGPNPLAGIEADGSPTALRSGWPIPESEQTPQTVNSDYDDTAPYPEAPADENT